MDTDKRNFGTNMQDEKIVCAAIRSGEHIILGVRHFDKFMQEEIERTGFIRTGCEQGFVTNKMRFLDRIQAHSLHYNWLGRGDCKLRSEDLY